MEFKTLKAVQSLPHATAAGQKSADAEYWGSFKNQTMTNHLSPVTSISTGDNGLFAVSSNARLLLFSTSLKRTISRFKEQVFCSAFSGRRLAAGDGAGLVQLFDSESRSILRTLRGHSAPVRALRFINSQTLLSVSDDASIRFWDIPTESNIHSIENAHSDYIRSCILLSSSILVSASYDATIKVWDIASITSINSNSESAGENGDLETKNLESTSETENSTESLKSSTKTKEPTITFNHGDPVEALLALPMTGLFASAGGYTIKIWDMKRGICIHTLSNHVKTVTSLALDASSTRMLSASLDGHVKVYSLDPDAGDLWRVVYSVKYPAPILSVCVSNDDRKLVVGMVNGLLSVRVRNVRAADIVGGEKSRKVLRTGSFKYFIRGAKYRPEQVTHSRAHCSQADVWVEKEKVKALKKYDRLLKKFQYSVALDAVLLKTQPPDTVICLIQELVHRDALKIALANRDDISLEPIARFLKKYITHPRYCAVLLDVTNVILDMYSVVIHQSAIIDELFCKISAKLKEEKKVQEECLQVLGMFDCLLNNATTMCERQSGHAGIP